MIGPPADWGALPTFSIARRLWRLRHLRRARRFAALREEFEMTRWLNAIRVQR